MKNSLFTAAVVTLLLGSPAAFAQEGLLAPADNAAPAAAGSGTAPTQGQSAADAFQNMSPEQRQQLIQTGVDKVQNLSPEQIQQYKAMFDSMPPEQKQQLEQQIMQQMQNNPQLKAEAMQKLQSLTPAQQQQLGGGQ